jgi:hypothetical protein
MRSRRAKTEKRRRKELRVKTKFPLCLHGHVLYK